MKIGNIVSKIGLAISKKSPLICLVGGVVCGAGALAMTARAAVKTKEHLDNIKEETAKRAEAVAKELEKDPEDEVIIDDSANINEEQTELYTNKERHSNIMFIMKQWLPVIALASASTVLLVKGYSIQSKRVAALTAAYAALEERYNSYKEAAKNKYGEEAEKEISEDADKINLEYKIDKKVLTSDMAYELNAETSTKYPKNDSDDQLVSFLYFGEYQLTNILRRKGYLYLNDAFEAYGMKSQQYGKMIGWYIPKGEDPDKYWVSTGLLGRDPDTGRIILADKNNRNIMRFNTDGVIFDKMSMDTIR